MRFAIAWISVMKKITSRRRNLARRYWCASSRRVVSGKLAKDSKDSQQHGGYAHPQRLCARADGFTPPPPPPDVSSSTTSTIPFSDSFPIPLVGIRGVVRTIRCLCESTNSVNTNHINPNGPAIAVASRGYHDTPSSPPSQAQTQAQPSQVAPPPLAHAAS